MMFAVFQYYGRAQVTDRRSAVKRPTSESRSVRAFSFSSFYWLVREIKGWKRYGYYARMEQYPDWGWVKKIMWMRPAWTQYVAGKCEHAPGVYIPRIHYNCDIKTFCTWALLQNTPTSVRCTLKGSRWNNHQFCVKRIMWMLKQLLFSTIIILSINVHAKIMVHASRNNYFYCTFRSE